MIASIALLAIAFIRQDARPQLAPGDPVEYRAALDKLPNNMEGLKAKPVDEWRRIVEAIFKYSPGVAFNDSLKSQERVTGFTIGKSFQLQSTSTFSNELNKYVITVNSERIGSVAFYEEPKAERECYSLMLQTEEFRKAVVYTRVKLDAEGVKTEATFSHWSISAKFYCSAKEAESLSAVLTWIVRGDNSAVTFEGERYVVDQTVKVKPPRWYKAPEKHAHETESSK